MYPDDLKKWLNHNQHHGYANHIAKNQETIRNILSSLGVPLDSELAYLYLNFGSFPVRGWYELNEPEAIGECTEYAHTELGVPKEFMALTSIEGQGITLFHKGTGTVFDVEYGQFEQLTAGVLQPIAQSFIEFLYLCKATAGESA